MEIEKQEHNIYNERLKFLDAKKSCYKLVVGALKSDPNARYSTTVTKTEEKTGLVLEWNITCLNNDLKVTIEWIDNSLYNFKGKKEDVQFIINLIRFNFHSLLDIEEGKHFLTLNSISYLIQI